MKKISIFVLAVLLLAPMSINAAERDETEGTMEALANDGTGTWVAINNGLTNTHINTLAVDPLNPSTIYAGAYGVFKSTNGGDLWSASNTRIDATVFALLINPQNTSIIYAGTVESGGIYKSTDGGMHWYVAASRYCHRLFPRHCSLKPIRPLRWV